MFVEASTHAEQRHGHDDAMRESVFGLTAAGAVRAGH